MMVLAVLVKNSTINLPELALIGLNRFRQAHHTRDYQPERIEISPCDKCRLPNGPALNGLPVVINSELEAGWLRVCTMDVEGIED